MKSLFSNPIDSAVPNNNFAYFLIFLNCFRFSKVQEYQLFKQNHNIFTFLVRNIDKQLHPARKRCLNIFTFDKSQLLLHCFCQHSTTTSLTFLDLVFGLFLYFPFLFVFSGFALWPVFEFEYEEQTKQSRIRNFKVTSGTFTNMIRLSTEVSFSDFVFSSKLVKA